MSAFVILDSISLATPDGRPLFDCLTLAIGRERTGLVGRNGCGKSSLLRVIGDDADPASGSVHRAGSIGTLAQSANESLTVAQYGCLALILAGTVGLYLLDRAAQR